MASIRTYVFVNLLLVYLCEGRSQKYNPNTDFLAHEAGGNVTPPKRDYVASNFPTLSPSSSKQTNGQPSWFDNFTPTTPKSKVTSGLRDYVAPQKPGHTPGVTNHASVTPQTPPAQKPVDNEAKKQTPSISPQPGGKRDYVAPQRPTPVTPSTQTSGQSGKVKDLINFYDGKPQNVPSYSSILKGPSDQKTGSTNSPTPSSTQGQRFPSSPTPKPLSFSSVVAGSNKPSMPSAQSHSTRVTPSPKPGNGAAIKPISTSTNRPLPSAILNNNKKEQNNGNAPSDAEIQAISEELLSKDFNNAAKYITINYQSKTSSSDKEDKSAQPLLTVPDNVWNIPTIQKFVPLLDNYERDVTVNEYVTPQERNEENAFMDAIMSTSVIRYLMTFLKDKGYVTPDPKNQRDFLKQLWFGLYSRGKGKISSSGFEHIFVSEYRDQDVLGLHNWIYFYKEEAARRANYLGYLKYVTMSDKGAVIKLHFSQQGLDKPVDTMFVGTSPELEIALYTLCFVTRADKDCNVKLGGKDVNIVTHTFRYRSKNYIGSSYPEI